MLTVPKRVCDRIRNAEAPSELYTHLQSAVELEHATIPPYLTALYSIRRGMNREVAGILRSVVVEEMLHMTIAANVLTAIGGHAIIDKPGFVPTYPGKLPMGVRPDLTVGLAPVSKQVVRDVFMEIEEPEFPQDFPTVAAAAAGEQVATIGEFYAAIIQKIQELGDGIFTGDPAHQVVAPEWFPRDELFPITDVDSATRGLTLIVQQGEGSGRHPLDPEGEPAHYYRFAEIVKGYRLRRDPTSKGGFSYSGAIVPLDPAGVFPLVRDSKASMYAPGTKQRRQVDRANQAYTHLLVALHDTFNGHPDRLHTAIGVMYELRLVIAPLFEMAGPTPDTVAAPSFEYVPVDAR